MLVRFHISSGLRSFAGGRDQVEIGSSPGTVAAALEALWALHPGLRDRVANEQGQIREHVNVFVGNENIRYTGGLSTPVPAGSEISILQAVSGGSDATQLRESSRLDFGRGADARFQPAVHPAAPR
jgi:molybdopterin synthase sulfur carrier subunit